MTTSLTCPYYSENSCCTEDDAVAIEELLDEVESQYSAFPQCVANFEVAYCGLSCSPAQYTFVRFEAGTPVSENITITYPDSQVTSEIINSQTYGKKYVRICKSFCQQWYDSCANATVGGIPINTFYRVASEFCTVNSPFEGLFVEVSDNNTDCYNGLVEVTDYSLSFVDDDAIMEAEAGNDNYLS